MNFYISSNIPYYVRIEISGGIDINKASASKERDICHCWCLNFKHIYAIDAMTY